MGVPNFSPLIAKRIRPVLEMKEIQRQKALIQATSEQEYYEQCWKMNDEALRTVRNQAELAQHLSRVSPLGSYMAAATTMARTGVEDTYCYKAYVMRWDKRRRDLEGAFFKPHWNRAEREEAGLFFAPVEMILQDSFAAIMVDLALLILFNVVFFMGAYLSFLRYDIR